MRKLTYEPEGDWSGKVEIDLPSQRSRLLYFHECNFSMKKGQVEGLDNVSSMLKMYDVAVKHVTKVNVKHKDGDKFNDFKKMMDDSLCDDLVEKIVSIVMQGGVSLGED